MVQLFHVYKFGRFGPEKHIGFILANDPGCIKTTTYCVFDIVKTKSIPLEFWTNPRGIGNIKKYLKWKRSNEKLMEVN